MAGSKPLTSGKKGSRAQATGSLVIWKEKPLTSLKNRSWAHGTGSHVFLNGKPLTSGKKGSRAQATGSHVIWKEKPLSSMKNRSWAQGEGKPRRKRGRKVQSPIFGMGVTHIGAIYGFDMVLIWHKSKLGSGANIKGVNPK